MYMYMCIMHNIMCCNIQSEIKIKPLVYTRLDHHYNTVEILINRDTHFIYSHKYNTSLIKDSSDMY